LLKPGLEQARRESNGLARSDEDVLSYALFPEIAKDFFAWRDQEAGKRQPAAADWQTATGQRPQ
jgi:pyruvate carboxylase subunit B